MHKNNVFLVCVSVGFVLLASKYYSNMLRGITQFCCSTFINNNNSSINKKRHLKVTLDKVILVESLEKCDYAVQCIRCNLSDGILGFNCEWVNGNPISLLQLATVNGVCALFFLDKIGHVPATLKALLASKRILKVGVAPFEAGQKLTKDFGCCVFGILDLKVQLADRLDFPSSQSFSALCLQYLEFEMDKVVEMRYNNWNAYTLTNDQVTYAAYNTIVPVLTYYRIMQEAKQQRTLWENFIIYLKSMWGNNDGGFLNEVIDSRFKACQDTIINRIKQTPNKNNNNKHENNIFTRNGPLYHNCYLQAPDGDILCTCNRKKAEWYINKKLGNVIKKDPLIVRLIFEPAGRALGEVGQYYTQVKINQCVVCGSSDKFIRKNVVPREYRKYFPLVMKAHQSHDVLLLCPSCHKVSNSQDIQLRKKLADMCNAPLSGSTSHVHKECRIGQQKLCSAVKALKKEPTLPIDRCQELKSYIIERTGVCEITQSLLEKLDKQLNERALPPPYSLQSKYQSHGNKVVEYFMRREGGLVELEKLWREHFLTNMKPQYLPKLWSVSHNQERLMIRQKQNRIQLYDAKVAGIQTTNGIEVFKL